MKNNINYKTEFNGEFETVVVLKSGMTYFPISCIDGSPISNSIKDFTYEIFQVNSL